MSTSYWRGSFIWFLKANAVVWAINSSLLAILLLLGFSWVNSGYFSKITLFETGISFLVAGALAFSGSALPSKAREVVLKSGEQWSIEKLRRSEKRANKYIVLAAILLVESILISFLGA